MESIDAHIPLKPNTPANIIEIVVVINAIDVNNVDLIINFI